MPILLLANTMTYLKRTLSLKGMADEQIVMEALIALYARPGLSPIHRPQNRFPFPTYSSTYIWEVIRGAQNVKKWTTTVVSQI
jgi:hypothetical protein